jgi:hypothetical protein
VSIPPLLGVNVCPSGEVKNEPLGAELKHTDGVKCMYLNDAIMSAECQEDKTVLALPELNVGSITSKIYCK